MSDWPFDNGQNSAMVVYGSANTATAPFSTDDRMVLWGTGVGTGMPTTAVVPAQPLYPMGVGNGYGMIQVQMTPEEYMGYQHWRRQWNVGSLFIRSSEQSKRSI